MISICQKCLTLNETEQHSSFTCTICSEKNYIYISNNIYEIGNKAARYGYDYRIAYDNQIKEAGVIGVDYCLEATSEILKWLGGIIFSGVIGNAAYDLIKNKVQKFMAANREHIDNNALKISATNESIDEFISNIAEWANDLKNLNPEVKKHILEEQIVEKLTAKSEKKLSQGEIIDESDIDFRGAAREVEKERETNKKNARLIARKIYK